MPYITKLIIQPPKVAYAPITLPTKTPGADTGVLPEEAILLQEEMNSAIRHFLMTRASIDTCQRKQVSDFKMAICQNKAKATEAIRDAKVHCESVIREVEACHATTIREAGTHCITTIREAEAHSSTIITEVEAHCAADIREAEFHCAGHACPIQQSHSDNMQHLEREAIEKEGKDCQFFLAAYGMALQVYPPEAHGVLMCPLQMLMMNMSLATLLAIPSQVSTTREEPTPEISHLTTPAAPVPSSGTKQWHHLSNPAACFPSLVMKLWRPLKSHTNRSRKTRCL